MILIDILCAVLLALLALNILLLIGAALILNKELDNEE